MTFPRKASDEQIAAAYKQARSCKGAAAVLGMCPQSVHERLCKLGLNRPVMALTQAERAKLLAEYSTRVNAGQLGELALEMGRGKSSLCRFAREMGLTNVARKKPYSADLISARMTEHYATHDHPRGMAGKRHGAATKRRISETSQQRWDTMTEDERSALTLRQMKAKDAAGGLAMPRPQATWKAGWREIDGQRCYFRSRWEANYARYLGFLRSTGHIEKWEHEPQTFWFDAIKRGSRSYLPDFRVTEKSGRVVYHEVKGWMDERSATKIKRMRIYHPAVELIVIERKGYEEIKRKLSSLLPGWES